MSVALLSGIILMSCQEELVDGSKYSTVFDSSKTPVAHTGTATKISAFFAVITGSASSADSIWDCGIMVADNKVFNKPTVVTSSTDGGDFQVKVTGLTDSTVYFYRSYAVNPSGGGAYGETDSLLTKVGVPAFSINAEADSVGAWSLIGFTTIDKDGDGEDWYFGYYDKDSTQGCYLSQSWNQGALTPENYLLLPGILLDGFDGGITIDLVAMDPDYYAEKFKVVISDSPITSENCQSAEVLYENTLPDAEVLEFSVDIPDSFNGKTVYIGLAHYDCSDNYALALTGFKVYYAK